MKTINFTKISAAGNDFVLIDNRKKIVSGSLSRLAAKLCDRRRSIGADGLLLLQKSNKADFQMLYFNSDGSRACMCGNGARAITRFANIIGIAKNNMKFTTDAGLIQAKINGESISVNLSDPHSYKPEVIVSVGGKKIKCAYINTGVPHVVVFVANVENVNVKELGSALRFHKAFAPAGANVNFVQVKNGSLIVRTYERGVEDETLACGTGVSASSVIGVLARKVKQPVNCIVRSGDKLTVSFDVVANDTKHPAKNLWLRGPAVVSFSGKVNI